MKTITINLKERSYPIHIGSHIRNHIQDIVLNDFEEDTFFIVTDKNVAHLYLDDLINHLKGCCVHYYIIEPGEESKSLYILEKIHERMLVDKMNRHGKLIALGGGVVGDIGGLAAATFMRGIDYIQIPTTLLAQVDSSVGGKVGVNLKNVKNVIGTFHHPRAVIIDVNYLNTLELKDIKSGLGEIFKYGLIQDFAFFQYTEKHLNNLYKLDNKILMEIIVRSLMIKKEIVEKDEREKGIRKYLNFGHTIGHGIESLGYLDRFTHGEAVILGMMYESKIAKHLGLIGQEYYDTIVRIMSNSVKSPKFTEKEINKIIQTMKYDKKNQRNRLVFVLPVSKGKVRIVRNIDNNLIVEILKEGLK